MHNFLRVKYFLEATESLRFITSFPKKENSHCPCNRKTSKYSFLPKTSWWQRPQLRVKVKPVLLQPPPLGASPMDSHGAEQWQLVMTTSPEDSQAANPLSAKGYISPLPPAPAILRYSLLSENAVQKEMPWSYGSVATGGKLAEPSKPNSSSSLLWASPAHPALGTTISSGQILPFCNSSTDAETAGFNQ